ncbi:alpha-2-macroglobulin domain-containing protein [Sphingomonas sp. MM-1]|uniref:alpha-2-macroglobulin family protein n=1 Tax=Sphingomonas sp. MM-1 TaxID=745310 RepID=UPI0002C0569B|nr:alpha-2-macroglobulin domain-containing protein [Sphingomonas sp. MM-1]
MMRRLFGMRWAALLLVLAPVAASSDVAPQVVMARPGGAGGLIERFTMRFSEPMVPLGDPRAAAPFAVACPVPGKGRWVDQSIYVHEFDRALPGGLSCALSLRDGLKTLRGATLAGQQRFVIDTGGPVARAVLPSRYGGDVAEDQIFLVAANVVPDRASVAQAAYCAVDGIGEKIAVDVLPPATVGDILAGMGPDRYEVRNFLSEAGLPEVLPRDAGERATALAGITALKCRRPLPPGRDMALLWGAGISGPGGRTAGADQRFDFTVRKAFEARFECSRVNPQAGCSPVEPANVRFTAPIARAAAEGIRIRLADGTELRPEIADKSAAQVSAVRFKAPFPESVDGRLLLPERLIDDSGRPLANAGRFPLDIRFDAAPPLVKFAAPFGILEAKEGGMLPVTVRNVEPALQGGTLAVGGNIARIDGDDGAVARWLRTIDKADDNDFREEGRGKEKVTVNHTGANPVLRNVAGARPMSLALPGKGRQFEVVGIPLAKPGFYVVELASPALGRALLGRDATRYVSAGALVTNLAVHFKWGRNTSLAWVTALDSGDAVAGADVRITDSCSGRLLAQGRSDARGRLAIRRLPEPETYGACDPDASHPLMISARKDGDFSFTLTNWSKGIQPYDFDLPYGWSDDTDIFHTIFDRSLMRAGDTVHMKHILRRPVAAGFTFAGRLQGVLRLTHRGSDTQFDLPLDIGADGIGETAWTAPAGAPQGDYDLTIVSGDRTIFTNQSIRVDEYRLPTMRATITGPKAAAVRPRLLPVDLFVGYLSGGGASNMGVTLRTAFQTDDSTPKGWEGWSFGGARIEAGVKPLDGDGGEIGGAALPGVQMLPVTLDGQGTAHTNVEIPQAIDQPTVMAVEMDYQDANGEVLTASRRLPIYPSAVRVGLKTDGWLMKEDDLRLKLVVLDVDGRPVIGRKVKVELYSREVISARRRLIGGFYAYDNSARTTRLKQGCTTKTDSLGLAECRIDPGVSGEIYAVATAEDDAGNASRAVRSLWLAGEDDWWFGGDNGDRMDLVPERLDYKSGETARFQVRMPFREATALVTVEREGVIGSFVTKLSGKDPVIEVPLNGAYAPDVYVSVMAVRGRIGGFRLWLANLARDWGLPFFSREGAAPTALVDLAKPSFRLGIAKINVGWEAHQLAVDVKADRDEYRIRDTAQVSVQVKDAAGTAPKSAEIAFAAVDKALLQLSPNPSWALIDAMMGERPLSVLTSTAQMQVVGKRHYGRKALAAGGGGGGDLSAVNREDFRPVLLWKGRVPLDPQGRAKVAVPLSDALSSFRLVAIATAGADRFGTGSATVRTTQDLTLYSGLPPLVRSGDFYGASFTLRNGSDRPMTVTATAEVAPRIGTARPLTVTIPAGGAAPVTWNLPAPAGIDRLRWTVSARASDGRAVDRITVNQEVAPAVPLETWAATLVRVGPQTSIMLAPPAGALPGRGEVSIRLTDSLAPPLDGVRRYMAAYPYDCFEQRLSKAVATDDAGAWGRLAGEIPAYIDRNGLLRYFPVESMEGSEALTAYVLHITAEAGFVLPEAARARMIEALKAVVDGRVESAGQGIGERRYLRLAALAALARNGAATSAMLGQIGLRPADMPSSALADWLVAIDRTGGDPALRQEAERVLRSRLVYEGSRFDLNDAGAAPWWMMTSGDEMAIRALMAILGRPGWQEDGPRMMVGVALRQKRGHWDTTPANAWGALAAKRFAALYPAEAVAGTTTATLGSTTRSQSWPRPTDAPLLRLPLPAARAPLLLAQNGGGGPWAQVALTAAVPLRQPLFAGYRIERQVSVIQQRVKGRFTRGDVLRIRISVDATAERNWVVVSDPIPAGATIVGNLGGQSQQLADQASDGEGVQPSYVGRGLDAWRGYFEWVPRGRFTVEYAVRLNGAGTFQLPPTRVEAMYSPDIHAALPNQPVTVALR